MRSCDKSSTAVTCYVHVDDECPANEDGNAQSVRDSVGAYGVRMQLSQYDHECGADRRGDENVGVILPHGYVSAHGLPS